MAARAACAKALWQEYAWYVQGGTEAGGREGGRRGLQGREVLEVGSRQVFGLGLFY